jgi:RNA:NAD 2'-phosphotransferase (TPT1/KptA family)
VGSNSSSGAAKRGINFGEFFDHEKPEVAAENQTDEGMPQTDAPLKAKVAGPKMGFRCSYCEKEFEVHSIDCRSCKSSYSLEPLLSPPAGTKKEGQDKEAKAKEAKQTGAAPADSSSSSSSAPTPAKPDPEAASGLSHQDKHRRSTAPIMLTDEGYQDLLDSSLWKARELLHKIDTRFVTHAEWWGSGVMERDRVIVSREHARITGYDPIDQANMPRGRRMRDLCYKVSRVLRHDASRHNIGISSAGWMNATDLLWAVRHSADYRDRSFPDADYDHLWEVFKSDASRYQVVIATDSGWMEMKMARAITGHSCQQIRSKDLYADRQRFELCADSPRYVFHGTYLNAVPSILAQGLIPGGLVVKGNNTERELFFSPLPPGHAGNPPGSQKAPGGKPHNVGIVVDFHQALSDGLPFHYTAGGAIVTRRNVPGVSLH